VVVCAFTDTIKNKNLNKYLHVWLKDFYVLEFSKQYFDSAFGFEAYLKFLSQPN